MKTFLPAILLSLFATGSTYAQSGKIIVGFPAGGAVDLVGRMVADGLRTELGENFILENRAGAQGRIAMQATKDAKPDGRTLIVTPGAALSLYPYTFKQLSYDPWKDFVAVAPLVKWDIGLAVAANSPAKTLQDFLKLAKNDKQYAFFGTASVGNTQHFTGTLLSKQSDVHLDVVGFKGGKEAVTALLGHQIPSVILNTGELLELQRVGRVRTLAIFSPTRSANLPDVPTAREAGFPGLQAQGWSALYAPAGTAPEVVQKINAAVQKILSSPAAAEKLTALGVTKDLGNAQSLDQRGRREAEQWMDAVKTSGFTPE